MGNPSLSPSGIAPGGKASGGKPPAGKPSGGNAAKGLPGPGGGVLGLDISFLFHPGGVVKIRAVRLSLKQNEAGKC